jgi:hypothetical protein
MRAWMGWRGLGPSGRAGRRAGRRVAALLLSLLVLSACEKPRDHYREELDTTRGWKPMAAAQSRLNIPALIPHRITRSERQLEDADHSHERLFLNGDKGMVYIHYVRDESQTQDDRHRIYSSFWFRNWIKNYFGSVLVDFENPREFMHDRDRGRGYYSLVEVANSKARCFVARAGYLLGHFESDGGVAQEAEPRFDTVIEFLFCDPRVSAREFLPLLMTIDKAGAK